MAGVRTSPADPAYDQKQSDPHDIAVVVLDKAVRGITPTRLPTRTPTATATRWPTITNTPSPTHWPTITFTPSARAFLEEVPNLRIEKPFDLKDVRRLVNELIR